VSQCTFYKGQRLLFPLLAGIPLVRTATTPKGHTSLKTPTKEHVSSYPHRTHLYQGPASTRMANEYCIATHTAKARPKFEYWYRCGIHI